VCRVSWAVAGIDWADLAAVARESFQRGQFTADEIVSRRVSRSPHPLFSQNATPWAFCKRENSTTRRIRMPSDRFPRCSRFRAMPLDAGGAMLGARAPSCSPEPRAPTIAIRPTAPGGRTDFCLQERKVKPMAKTTFQPLHFPVGYHALHADVAMNFQMNRFWNWVGEDQMLAELREVGPKIIRTDDWIRELLVLGDRAMQADRRLPAAYFLRMAEFFMKPSHPRYSSCREKFLEVVLAEHKVDASMRHRVPYGKSQLTAYRLPAAEPSGTLVVFGGFDSYIEEWWPILLAWRAAGLDVIAFDGPGQGAALHEGIPMTSDWHQPVAAVLDYFKLDDVALLGFSLGGGLAIRGAALEPRVTRVVALDICSNFYGLIGKVGLPEIEKNLNYLPAAVVNAAAERLRRSSDFAEWFLDFGSRVTGTSSSYDHFRALRSFRTDDISALVTQDVLLLAGAGDHLVPLEQLGDQIRSLTNARSIAARTFTYHEQAQNHCQIGNLALVATVVVDWLNSVGPRRAERPR
jgi:alpha-beta hydrolase superfamily lysophospholipase